MTIAELKGASTVVVFIVFIDLLILVGLGVCFPRKCLTFQPLRLFLVASETRVSFVGRSLSVISTGCPPL